MLAEAVLNGLWQGLAITTLSLDDPAPGAAHAAPPPDTASGGSLWAVVLALPMLYLATAPLGGPVPVAGPAAPLPIHLPQSWPAWLLAGWAIGFALMLGRLAWSYGYVRWLARTGKPLAESFAGSGRALDRLGSEYAFSARARPPYRWSSDCVQPSILMPHGLIERLDPADTDQIILHEWAHIRRRDHWSNCALEFVKALFFFHPAVWWIARHVRLEREIACDDAVVAATGKPAHYAGCLLKLAELRMGPGVSLSTAAAGNGSDLVRRVERLLDWPGSAGFSAGKFFAVAAMLVAAVAVTTHVPRLVDIPQPALALRPMHTDLDALQRVVLAEVRMRTANIWMEMADHRLAAAERLLRSAREQTRMARRATGDVSRVSCITPTGPAADLRLNKI